MPLKPISFFLLKAALIYAVLMIPWPGVREGYRAGFRAVGNVMFSSLKGGMASVRFEPYGEPDPHKDTELVLRKPPRSGRTEIGVDYLSYRPTAFLVALVLATPVPWRRRSLALLVGLVFINLFIAFRVWLRVFDALSDGNVLSVYALSEFWKNVVRMGVTVLVRAPVPTYIVPAFVWLLVSFRRGDLQALAGARVMDRAADHSGTLAPAKRSTAKAEH